MLDRPAALTYQCLRFRFSLDTLPNGITTFAGGQN